MKDKNNPEYIFTCTSCKIPKPNKEFGKRKGQRRIREYSSKCTKCLSKMTYIYNKANPEKRKLIVKKYIMNNKEKRTNLTKNYKLKNPFNYLINTCKGNSKHRNLEFNIVKEDLITLFKVQEGRCYYTGRDLKTVLGFPESVSVDRVDSSKGYLIDNIVLCQSKVNIMKNNASIDELIDFCVDILKTGYENENFLKIKEKLSYN